MDMKQLEVFTAVMEENSFSKAAATLHLTQPTVSAHIASLERELQIKLIVRTTKEIYPSDAGRLLYDYACKMLETRREAVEAIRAFSCDMQGSVSLIASTVPGQYYLPKLLQSFREKYPDILFNIQMSDSDGAVAAVSSHSAEIGFCGTLPDAPKCLCQEFSDDKLVIIAPNTPTYQQYRRLGFPLWRLMEESFISREEGSGTRKETELFLREMGVDCSKLKIAIEVHSNDDIKRMVSEGLGIAVISKAASESYCRFGKLLAFDFDNVGIRRKLYIVRNKNGILSPIAQTFFDFAKDYYRRGRETKST